MLVSEEEEKSSKQVAIKEMEGMESTDYSVKVLANAQIKVA